MASGSIHVKVSGLLHNHTQQQIGDHGLYENASEYFVLSFAATYRRVMLSGICCKGSSRPRCWPTANLSPFRLKT